MQNTTNYNLNKPDGTDYAKIQALNENADIIDAALKSLSDALGGIDLATLSQAIANVDSRVTTHLAEYAIFAQEVEEYKNDVEFIKEEVHGARIRLINLANSVVDSIV